MTQTELIKQITAEVLRQLSDLQKGSYMGESIESELHLQTTNKPQNPDALPSMMLHTPARIGVGKAGPRLQTQTVLKLRADHASARDSVYRDVDENVLREVGLFSVSTLCADRNEHITRPDLGRQFSADTLKLLKSKCILSPQVQVYLSDGLSSQAVDANVADILPALLDGLQDFGISTGTPFFVKYGRVPAMDIISQTLDAEVTCVLIGERPGLATANSMSAYIAYRATPGMPEARRTVISNIHSGGIPAPAAGAHIAQVIKTIMERKVSGVDLSKEG